MIIEELNVKRENGRRITVPTGKVFESFTEVYDYCIEYGSKPNQSPDMLILKFRILDSNEIFSVAIGWDRDSEVYVSLDFPKLRE